MFIRRLRWAALLKFLFVSAGIRRMIITPIRQYLTCGAYAFLAIFALVIMGHEIAEELAMLILPVAAAAGYRAASIYRYHRETAGFSGIVRASYFSSAMFGLLFAIGLSPVLLMMGVPLSVQRWFTLSVMLLTVATLMPLIAKLHLSGR